MSFPAAEIPGNFKRHLQTGKGSSMAVKCHILLLGIVLSVTGSLGAEDQVITDVLSTPVWSGNVKSLGGILFALKDPKAAEANKLDLKKSFWAFQADANLTPEQLAEETRHFDTMCDSLAQVTRSYDVNAVSFIGIDQVCLIQCQDWYYAAFTPKGPVVFKLSCEFNVGNKARIFGIEEYAGWHRTKIVVSAIQHKVGEHVPVISPHVPDAPKKAD
jgi:hypothetical protein